MLCKPCLFSALLLMMRCRKCCIDIHLVNKCNNPLPNIPIYLKHCTSDKTYKLLTNKQGVACFNKIPPGRYTINIIYGNKIIKKCICIKFRKCITLCLDTYIENANGIIYGTIKDLFGPIKNAFVGLYKVIKPSLYYPINFTYTDRCGKYFFRNIDYGSYIIKAIK